MSTLDLFMRRFAVETFDPKRREKEAIWARWKSRLETEFFGGRELMVRKPRAPAMSKEEPDRPARRLLAVVAHGCLLRIKSGGTAGHRLMTGGPSTAEDAAARVRAAKW